jgi:hypothetical protein
MISTFSPCYLEYVTNFDVQLLQILLPAGWHTAEHLIEFLSALR